MKIAHISDLHMRYHLYGSAAVPDRLSRLMPDRLTKAVSQIVADAPDLLVLSGDLLDYPIEDMESANPMTPALGLGDLRLIAQILEDASCPLALVHGNHDNRELVRQVFAHAPDEQVVAGHRVLCFWDEEDDDNVPRRIAAERERFDNALTDTTLPQIHVQHYVVWPERNEGYPHTYGDGARLRQQIVQSGAVKLVLSGHYHIGVPLFEEKGVYFCTVRGFTEAPHYYNIYEIKGNCVTCEYRQLEA
ncbi:MAG: metallophosphoesterase [Caldilineaceae bacterium]